MKPALRMFVSRITSKIVSFFLLDSSADRLHLHVIAVKNGAD